MDVTPRLDRIESKLDQLSETLATLARVEERQFAQTKRMDRFEFRLDEYERASDQTTHKSIHHGVTIAMAERVGWACFAVLLSALAKYVNF